MWKCIFIAIFTFSTLATKAQKVKIYNTKEFRYRVCYTATGGRCSVDTIVIFRQKDDRLIQRLIPPENKCYCGVKYDPLTIDDYNFDNHEDISIVQLIPSSGSVPYYYWFYNVEASSYVRNAQLEKIKNPHVDKKNKWIVSEWKESETLLGSSMYSWVDGTLTQTQEVQQEYVGDDDGTGFIEETTSKLVKGKMKVVSKKKKDWDEGLK